MIKNLLLFLSLGIILLTYIRIMINSLSTKNKPLKELTGFDVAKEITSNYEEINIVESKEVTLSKYNLKRNIIRLTPKNYEGTDLFTLSISSYLAGYSLANVNQNKYLNILKSILPNIDYLNKSPIIAILIALFTNTTGDAKIALIFLTIILVYQYLIIQITTESSKYIQEELDKFLEPTDIQKMNPILSTLLKSNTIFFVTTLILIIYEVVIIMNI